MPTVIDLSDSPLEVRVVSSALVISIGMGTLTWAAEHMEENNPYDDDSRDFKRLWRVKDAAQFAKDVRSALRDEGEDGSTPLTRLLDAMCLAAIEDGSVAVDEDGRLHTDITDHAQPAG